MISLGVDVGTTRTKVLALDIHSGETLALETAETPVRSGSHGDDHRPVEVLETVLDLVSRVTRSLERPAEVAAICCASVGEEVVLLDGQDQPVSDAIAWYDPRGHEQAEMFAAGPGSALRVLRDYPPDPSFSLFKLIWIRDHRPGDLERAVAWTDLGDYVLSGLGGELVMDWTHASRAGAFDLVTRAWDQETVQAARVGLRFPRLVPSGTVIGSIDPGVALRAGLPNGVSIVSGGHDHLCGAFGAGLRSASVLFLSAGTSEAHLALLQAPIPPSPGRYRLDQGCYVDDHAYYAHLAIPSGHIFRQWRGLLYEGVQDEDMYAEVAAAVPDAAGISFELLDDLRHGRLDHLPYTAGRAALMRAILAGLAHRSADLVDFLEAASGTTFELILAAGHPALVPLWRELRQAAYGRPLEVVSEPESAAFGAAVIAARALAGARPTV
jgi:sugar (pentulose or hexulose) kinase